jgi:hypothetical protein
MKRVQDLVVHSELLMSQRNFATSVLLVILSTFELVLRMVIAALPLSHRVSHIAPIYAYRASVVAAVRESLATIA